MLRSAQKSRAAFFGATCLDVVLRVPHYPSEDTEVRVQTIERATGGNATNAARVCAQLCAHISVSEPCAVDLVSVIPDPTVDDDTRWTMTSLAAACVGTRYMSVLPLSSGLPISYIALTAGSRTIFHSRGIPELDRAAAERAVSALCAEAGPHQLLWLHFEGRAIEATAAALRLAASSSCDETRNWVLSVELEKPRSDGDVETLLPLVDVVFVGREYATTALHCTDAIAAITNLTAKVRRGALIVATWGEDGAYAWVADGLTATCSPLHVPAHVPPSGIVDTIGAGDSFIAAAVAGALLAPCSPWLRRVIDSRKSTPSEEPAPRCEGHDDTPRALQAWLEWACLVAGLKCGQSGLHLDGAALDAIAAKHAAAIQPEKAVTSGVE
jgi:ketohexokinase